MFVPVSRSTATSTYRLVVYQIAIETVVQVVLATDGLTRFGGTTISHLLTSGGLPSVGLCRLSTDDDSDDDSWGSMTQCVTWGFLFDSYRKGGA